MPRTPLDISAPLGADTPSYPGDPPPRITVVRSLERGDPYRMSALSLGSHSGTHLDAPSHFLPAGRSVDTVDLTLLNGPVRVVAVEPARPGIGAAEAAEVPAGTRRVLFRTRNSDRWAAGEPFFPDYVAVDPAAAEILVARGVGLVGVDGLSVESDPTQQFPVHHRLLGAGVWILEGLRLSGVAPGEYDLGCLPLRLVGVDASPCRVVLWR
ncbi:MAG TPA: cyclase family protein [Thermoplasmata archaeon]|nr:cyclase family protein [Thermoplasmata archaeon]